MANRVEPITPSMPLDFCESSLEYAAHALGGVLIRELHVYISFACQRSVRDLADKWGYSYTLLPEPLLRTPFAWAVTHARGIFYSEPQ